MTLPTGGVPARRARNRRPPDRARRTARGEDDRQRAARVRRHRRRRSDDDAALVARQCHDQSEPHSRSLAPAPASSFQLPLQTSDFKLQTFCCNRRPRATTPPLLETSLAGLTLHPPRQGPRRVRSRRPPADRRDRSHLRVRLRPRIGHSRQGQGPDAAVGVLVRSHGRPRAAPSARDGRRHVSRAAPQPRGAARGPIDARAQDRARARSSASRADISPAPAGRTISRPAASAASRCPPGLRESDRLPEPIFTPATKAESGHDENISEAEAAQLVGAPLDRPAEGPDARTLRARRRPRRIEGHHHRRHEVRVRLVGGGDPATDVVLIDEVLTPDSSRFWPSDEYEPGHGQPSFDKQFVRDYLEAIGWNKQPPVPSLPDDVVQRTRDKYLEAYRLLSRPRAAVARARPSRGARPADDRPRHPVRRRPAGVRADVHHPRAAATNYNVCKAAKMTGLHRNTLARKMTRTGSNGKHRSTAAQPRFNGVQEVRAPGPSMVSA